MFLGIVTVLLTMLFGFILGLFTARLDPIQLTFDIFFAACVSLWMGISAGVTLLISHGVHQLVQP